MTFGFKLPANSVGEGIMSTATVTHMLLAKLVGEGKIYFNAMSCCWFPELGLPVILFPQTNRPFLSSLVPLFQSKSKCETIFMKMTLICMKMRLHAELIFI